MRRFCVKAFLALLLLAVLAGCAPKHRCVFDQKSPDAAFLASKGDCATPDSYYYSCSCGAKGTETFPGETRHTPGDWIRWRTPSCTKEGTYVKFCTLCNEELESKPIPTVEHAFSYGVCSTCYRTNTEEKDGIMELGIPTALYYTDKLIANNGWDIVIRDGILYRGAGDYSANSGATTIWAYNIATGVWSPSGKADDEAVHRFVDLNGTLTALGTDATGNWEFGNFYQLIDGKWQKFRTIAGGVHVYDMAVFDGKIFAGIGTDVGGCPVSVSTDGGQTFQSVPLYVDGQPLVMEEDQFARCYELLTLNGKLYAEVTLSGGTGGSSHALYRYKDGKLHYLRSASAFFATAGASYNYIHGEFDLNGVSYFGSCRGLFAVTDTDIQKIPLPGGETVADCFLDGGTVYVLSYKYDSAAKMHNTVIYKTTTMTEGSFQEVKRFAYPVCPLAFAKDGNYLYLSMGYMAENEKNGTILRIQIP